LQEPGERGFAVSDRDDDCRRPDLAFSSAAGKETAVFERVADICR